MFSLGAVLVFAATGEGPFGPGAPTAVMYRVVHGTPRLDGLPGPVLTWSTLHGQELSRAAAHCGAVPGRTEGRSPVGGRLGRLAASLDSFGGGPIAAGSSE